MSPSEIGFKAHACHVGSMLLLCVGAAVLSARADDPDRAEVRGTLVEELQWKGPLGTAGTPDIRAQRDALWGLVTARYKEFHAGKISLDLLLETDRFFREADRQCAATPGQWVRTSRAALARTEEIRALASRKLAAGQITRADMQRVVGQVNLFELQLKEDIESARQAVKNP